MKDPVEMGLFKDFPGGAEAWVRLTEGRRYRVATAADFNIPAAAMDKYGHDISRAIEFAFVGEDINRDAVSYDTAFIVVDTSRPRADRFSLVILNASKDKGAVPRPHWVYRDRDLARSVLSWASGGLSLLTYRDDGSFDHCYINWDREKQDYFCAEEYDGSRLGWKKPKFTRP